MLIFKDFLPLKVQLVATFNETCALTSRKYVVAKALKFQNQRTNINFFRCAPPFLF